MPLSSREMSSPSIDGGWNRRSERSDGKAYDNLVSNTPITLRSRLAPFPVGSSPAVLRYTDDSTVHGTGGQSAQRHQGTATLMGLRGRREFAARLQFRRFERCQRCELLAGQENRGNTSPEAKVPVRGGAGKIAEQKQRGKVVREQNDRRIFPPIFRLDGLVSCRWCTGRPEKERSSKGGENEENEENGRRVGGGERDIYIERERAEV